jgi:hypothetical protein
MKGLGILISFLSLFQICFGQYGNVPLNNEFEEVLLKGRIDKQFNFHSSIKPFQFHEIDSLHEIAGEINYDFNKNWMDMLINYDTSTPKKDNLHLFLLPHFSSIYAIGQSNDSADIGQNLEAGLYLGGYLTNYVSFSFNYVYSENRYADYIEERIQRTGVVPGIGYARERNDRFVNEIRAWNVMVKPVDYFNLQFGVDKNFIGNGYRSLLLSDNSNFNPFAKLTLKIWKLKYQVLYSNYTHVVQDPGFEVTGKVNKYSTSGFLSMNFGKNLNVGLFQTVMMYEDEQTGRSYDVNYLNPVVFLRPVEFSVGSPDNILLGLDFRYRFLKKNFLYGQFVLDEFLLSEVRANNGWWGNKYGYQIGLKSRDVLNLKGLSLLAEHNYVRPFTYSHSNPYQNYGNFNEAIAHTLGANFYEFIGRASYTRYRWLFQFHSMLAVKGEDFSSFDNYGGDIFKSNTSRTREYDNVTGQGISTRKQYYKVTAGYLVVPSWRWMFEVGYSYRHNKFVASELTGEFSEYNYMIHFGIRTLLFNQYFDF